MRFFEHLKAPFYVFPSVSEGVIISSKTNDFEQLSYETKENYHVYSFAEKSNEVICCETSTPNHMPIVHKNDSLSSSSSFSIAYKSNVQSVIQSTNSSNNGCISTPVSIPTESPSMQQHNVSRSHTTIHDPNDYERNASPPAMSNQYFVLRSSTGNTTTTTDPTESQTPPAYRERSIEETEAAHDLLSLSQSLPPLPAPTCVVTILGPHPVTTYNGNSSDVQEIIANHSNEYITYTSGRTVQYPTAGADHDEICTRNRKNVSTQFDGDMLPEDSSSSGMILLYL